MPAFTFRFPQYTLAVPLPVTLAGEADVYRPVIPVTLLNPARTQFRRPVELLLDSGSDACYFPEWVAHLLHIPLAGAPLISASGAGGPLQARFRPIALQIVSRGSVHRWETVAGFVPHTVPLFRQGAWSGVLGNVGGLDQFRVTFDWCASPPTLTLTNCRASLALD